MEDNFLSCQLIYKRLSHNIMLLKNTTILLVVQIICFGRNKQKLLIILYLPMLHVYQKISCFTLSPIAATIHIKTPTSEKLD